MTDIIYGKKEKSLELQNLLTQLQNLHKEQETITCSEDVYTHLLDYAFKDKEHFILITFDAGSRILGTHLLNVGTQIKSLVDRKDLFTKVLLDNAQGFIVAHNHPSGILIPSKSDLSITRLIEDGSKLMEVQLLDHIIIAKTGYYSMADMGDIA